MSLISRFRPVWTTLSLLGGCASTCSAAVVVLSNRTPDKVEFILVQQDEDEPRQLAPGELVAVRIGAATQFRFTSDPNHGYRLRGGCAYVFLRNRAGRYQLHRMGLAGEQTQAGDGSPSDHENLVVGLPVDVVLEANDGSQAQDRKSLRHGG